MKHPFRRIFAPALAVAVALMLSGAAQADEAFDAAVGLLRAATHVDTNGDFNSLLRSLRQLGDPDLEPVFESLAQSDQPSLKIHGVLGLAECTKSHKIDLARLIKLGDPAVEAKIVTAAMDSNLLSLDQEQQVYDWADVDIAVKTIIAAPLVQAGKLTKLDALRQAASSAVAATAPDKTKPTPEELKSKGLARQGLANLLLLQLGDADAAKALEQLNHSDDAARDGIRDMMLTTAGRYEFDKVGPWAEGIAADPAVGRGLGLTALAVAMRFNAPGSGALWDKRFQAATDTADRLRLALVALRLAPWADPKLYAPLLTSNDMLIQRIGGAGQAVAAKKDIAPAIVALVNMHHFLSNSWAMGYAKDRAAPDDAKAILIALVEAYQNGPDAGKVDRLDDAVTATEVLTEKDSDAARTLLRPILTNKNTDPLLLQAILLGLIRTVDARPQDVVADLPIFEDPSTRALTLLLQAKRDVPLTPDQIHELGLAVRGGGLRQDALRTQAAWAYLKLTHQTKAAIDLALAK